VNRTQLAAARAGNPLEFEQAELRLLIACLVVIFIVASCRWDYVFIALGGFCFACGQLGWVVLRSRGGVRRRAAGVLLDVGFVTAAMALVEAAGVVLFGLYLWIALDNGARFGLRYLRCAQGLALAAFAALLFLSPFWRQHLALGVTLLLVLAAIPFYAAGAIGRLHAASHFAAAADHHLRQPLLALSVYASVLEQRVNPSPADTDATRLLRNLELLLGALERHLDLLLLLSDLEAETAKPAVSAFPLQPLLERAVEAERPLAGRRQLELRVVATAASVRSDPALLERMLTHLLSCAIRGTERGRIVVGCRRSGARVLHLHIVSSARAAERAFELPVVQRLGRLLDHSVTVTPAAFSIELERAG
jgi:signal transduction histidine kinase